MAEVLAGEIGDLDFKHAYSQVLGRLTVSMGVASIVASPDSGYETLLKAADNALYKAKENGRNGYHFFTADLNQAAARRMAL